MQKQVLAIYLIIAFSLGVAFAKWDSKHGYEWGMKMGKQTREFFNTKEPAHD